MNSWVVAYLWLIPAAPFAASLVILSLSNARRKSAAALAVAGQALALAMSTVAFALSMQAPGFRAVQNFTWFTFGEQALRLGWLLDPLAAAMLVMITLVSLCIFVFSIGYMAEDKNFVRFFAYLSFFSAAMLGLVIANSLLLLFICWELVGLASYLLIGFWIDRPSAAVAAGGLLAAPCYPVFAWGAVEGVTASLTVVVSIGVITALMASLIALGQFDIKRILAYSTVSQLGLMMVSLGVGGVAAGMMHLIAHGFFKALLFLGAGSVIHGCHQEHDIRKMGGLRGLMPVTFLTYAVGMMTLSGIPFFFSGSWTKEEILHATSHWLASHVPHYLMLAGVVLTAFNSTRNIIYFFFGTRRTASEHAHESPCVMTMPLIALAACSILFGIVLTPAWPWLHAYLTGEPSQFDIAQLIQPMLFVSLALVAAGVGLGFAIYRKAAETDPLEQAQPALFRFLKNKMLLDELYDRTVVAFSRMAARLSDWIDRHVWDRLVRAVGGLGRLFGVVATSFDERGINAGVDEATTGTRGLGRVISGWHSGQIRTYLRAVGVSLLVLLVLYAWLT